MAIGECSAGRKKPARERGRWNDGTVSTFDATYYDVVPNERLGYAYEMRQDGAKISVSLATMELEAEGARTTLRITEQNAFLDGYDDAGREPGARQANGTASSKE